eukprot:CAMPEP_0182422658 /NCGR_PEP_ID=MMETSP1167-20130531/8401_1 /TAXON_ID=2988 /ORGANISM="Mallomonas Sp, Strain CCMP3275" /LENGTH=1499 /DNA_ID=CAMNT_0024600895 /DNA_START=12 /DNA_END=4508 /DNA_ORIENTATION=+
MSRFGIDIETEGNSFHSPVKNVQPQRQSWDSLTQHPSGVHDSRIGITSGFQPGELSIGRERSAFQNIEAHNRSEINDSKNSLTPGPKLRPASSDENMTNSYKGAFEHGLSSILIDCMREKNDPDSDMNYTKFPDEQSAYQSDFSMNTFRREHHYSHSKISNNASDDKFYSELQVPGRRSHSFDNNTTSKPVQNIEDSWRGWPSSTLQTQHSSNFDQSASQHNQAYLGSIITTNADFSSDISATLPYQLDKNFAINSHSDWYPSLNDYNPSLPQNGQRTIPQAVGNDALNRQFYNAEQQYMLDSLSSVTDDGSPVPKRVISNSPERNAFRRDVAGVGGESAVPKSLSKSDSLFSYDVSLPNPPASTPSYPSGRGALHLSIDRNLPVNQQNQQPMNYSYIPGYKHTAPQPQPQQGSFRDELAQPQRAHIPPQPQPPEHYQWQQQQPRPLPIPGMYNLPENQPSLQPQQNPQFRSNAHRGNPFSQDPVFMTYGVSKPMDMDNRSNVTGNMSNTQVVGQMPHAYGSIVHPSLINTSQIPSHSNTTHYPTDHEYSYHREKSQSQKVLSMSNPNIKLHTSGGSAFSNAQNQNQLHSHNQPQSQSQSHILKKKVKVRPSSAGKFTTPNPSLNTIIPTDKDGTGSGSRHSRQADSNEVQSQGKAVYKEFYRQFRLKERESVEAAREYAKDAVLWVPEDTKWRVLLELADLTKRNNEFKNARKLYQAVSDRQPHASQVWLEWSKMEDELGNIESSLIILRRGLRQCTFNEALLTKAIKQQERLHNLREAREMLSVLKHEPIDRAWRAVLEGTLLEARAGEIATARKFLKYLISHVPWYGPIYFEAFRLEEKSENWYAAIDVVRKGLDEIPRYGPLWFGLLRLMERFDVQEEKGGWLQGATPMLRRVREKAQQAVLNISRELVWKVHFEQAQAEERAVEVAALGLHRRTGLLLCRARDMLLNGARKCYVRSLLGCPKNLRWKAWLAGARMELSANRIKEVRRLLRWALNEAPEKSRSHVCLECSRVEEYVGNLGTARKILAHARADVRCEWKVYLESVLLEARAGNLEEAVIEAEKALEQHSGTGRLWAVLVQLTHRREGIRPCEDATSRWEKFMEGSPVSLGASADSTSTATNMTMTKVEAKLMSPKRIKASSPVDRCSQKMVDSPQKKVLLRALREVPKSGEVWCEGARTHLNPLLLESFDLGSAQKCLGFAIQFTPQYGDTFIEYLRLELICQVILPRVLTLLNIPIAPFFQRFLCTDEEADCTELTFDERMMRSIIAEMAPYRNTDNSRETRRKTLSAMMKMELDIGSSVDQYRNIRMSNLHRRCTNADPNYGTVWFFCRQRPIDNPITVIEFAIDLLRHEMTSAQPLYVRAVCHFVRKSLESKEDLPPSRQGHKRSGSGSGIRGKISGAMYHKFKRPSSAPTQGARNGQEPATAVASSSTTSTSSSSNLQSENADLRDNASTTSSTGSSVVRSLEEVWTEQAEKDKLLLEDFEASTSSLCQENW